MISAVVDGTYPLKPIQLRWAEPLPLGCVCKWDYDYVRRIKWVKFLGQGCPVLTHAIAWSEARAQAPIQPELPSMKRQRGDRGKDKKPRLRPEEKASLITPKPGTVNV